MKKLYILIPFSACVILGSILRSHTDGPLKNNLLLRVTGAPGENTCYFCHTAYLENSGPGSITVTSSGGTAYAPGGNYLITVTVTQSAIPKYGFQMTALNGANLRAGTFSPVINTDTFLVGGRHYIEHNGANSTGVWMIPWQAPQTNVGDITFYATGVAAMFPTGTPGDYPYSTTLTISPIQPPVAGFNGPPERCVDEPAAFTNTSTGATSYEWTFQGGNPPTSTNTNPIVNYSNPGIFDVTLIAMNAAGADTAKSQMIIHPLPDPTITPFGPLCCPGSPVQPQAATPGGVWFGPGIGPAGAFDPCVAGPGFHTIIYCVTDQNGCTACDTFVVEVMLAPPPSTGPNVAICFGDSVQLGANPSAGTTYNWTPITGLSNPSVSNPNASPPVTTTYTLTAQWANGCISSGTVTVTVNPLPDATINPINPTNTLCAEDSVVQLTAATSGGVWSGPGVIWDGQLYPSSAGPGTHNIVHEITDLNGCSSSDTLEFIVLPPITLTTITVTDATTPQSNNGAIDVTPDGGTPPYSFMWSNGATTEDIGNLYPGLYHVTVTDANDCEAIYTDIEVKAMSVLVSPVSRIPLTVYPNPAIDLVEIDWPVEDFTEVVLTDLQGSVVLQQDHLKSVDLSGIAPGCYVLRVVASRGIGVTKLVVAR